jgi:hypothetical protein
VIDITSSPIIPISAHRKKLEILLHSQELDCGLLITEHGIPINFISTTALQNALRYISNTARTACLLSSKRSGYPHDGRRLYESENDIASYYLWHGDEADLTSYLGPVGIYIILSFRL